MIGEGYRFDAGVGVLRGLLERKVDLPSEVSIVGYDDIDFASSAAVSLTSIRQPAYQIGQGSASLLLEEVSPTKMHAHQQVLFRPELVERESTSGVAPMRIADSIPVFPSI